jgi:hypothetical protein
MASRDPLTQSSERRRRSSVYRQLSRRGLRDGMRRWTNGLPGATKRLGAMMAHRGLSASQPGCARIPMTARSAKAPLQRPNTLLQLSRSTILDLCLATHGRAIHLALNSPAISPSTAQTTGHRPSPTMVKLARVPNSGTLKNGRTRDATGEIYSWMVVFLPHRADYPSILSL